MVKKKKLKLKKSAYKGFIACIILFVGLVLALNYYNDYKYSQTYEYKLVEKGYTLEESKQFIAKLKNETIENILNSEKKEIIPKLINEKYFLEKNLDAYLEYDQKEEDTKTSDIIALVNTHASKKWYQLELKTDTSKKEKMNVNKFFMLEESYTPENLKQISLDYAYGNGENKLIDYAYEEFQNLWEAAHEDGYYLMVTSSYRNYKDQEEIYNYRKTTLGERKADETAARPGHSEHQTGLVVDMTSKTEPTVKEFTESKAYKWLKENAYKYGWIERYPEGKTYITGYSPESWHWRYVGKEAAKVIQEEQITYDEYYAFYIE